MSLNFKSLNPKLDGIYAGLFAAGQDIYAELKKGAGLKFAATGNESGDDQLELDIIADEAFFTGTAAEVLPIYELDGRTIGAGKRGPITEKLQSLYFNAVRGELPDHTDWLAPVHK